MLWKRRLLAGYDVGYDVNLKEREVMMIGLIDRNGMENERFTALKIIEDNVARGAFSFPFFFLGNVHYYMSYHVLSCPVKSVYLSCA